MTSHFCCLANTKFKVHHHFKSKWKKMHVLRDVLHKICYVASKWTKMGRVLEVLMSALCCRWSPKVRWLSTTTWAVVTSCGHGPSASGSVYQNGSTLRLRRLASKTAIFPCSCQLLLWKQKKNTSLTLPQRLDNWIMVWMVKNTIRLSKYVIITIRFDDQFHNCAKAVYLSK